jgi:DNA-binding CsgD family transcriptional regulator
LDFNVNRWIAAKSAEAVRISERVAEGYDWSAIDEIPKGDENSTVFRAYLQRVESLSQRYFHAKEGSVYLSVIDQGEEYDIDPGDRTFYDFGPANDVELRAYKSHAPTSTATPISDSSGTFIGAYTPLLKNGRVVGLLGAEFDSAPLSDFQGIVSSAFWFSILPALLASLIISYVLAQRFVPPMEVLREFDDVRKYGLTQSGGWKAAWNLTDREDQVLALLGEALENADIARRLSISRETVKSHVASLLRKSGLRSRVALAIRAAVVAPLPTFFPNESEIPHVP